MRVLVLCYAQQGTRLSHVKGGRWMEVVAEERCGSKSGADGIPLL